MNRQERAKPISPQESVLPSGAISPSISISSQDISVEPSDSSIEPMDDAMVSISMPQKTDEPLSAAELVVPEVLTSAEIELHVDIHWATGFLNMSRRTVERYVEKGLITAIKYPSGQVYFLKSHLEELVELKKQSGLEYKDLVSMKNKSRLTEDIKPPQNTFL